MGRLFRQFPPGRFTIKDIRGKNIFYIAAISHLNFFLWWHFDKLYIRLKFYPFTIKKGGCYDRQ